MDNYFPKANRLKTIPKTKEQKSIFLWLVATLFLMFIVIGLVYHYRTNVKSHEPKDETEAVTKPIWDVDEIAGSWVVMESDTPVFGGKQVTETFCPDGTWQCGHPEGIMESGTWELQGSSDISIHVTGITAGSTFSPSDEHRTYTIHCLYDDRMEYIAGDKYIKLLKTR